MATITLIMSTSIITINTEIQVDLPRAGMLPLSEVRKLCEVPNTRPLISIPETVFSSTA